MQTFQLPEGGVSAGVLRQFSLSVVVASDIAQRGHQAVEQPWDFRVTLAACQWIASKPVRSSCGNYECFRDFFAAAQLPVGLTRDSRRTRLPQ
jgi:hypothetical protein